MNKTFQQEYFGWVSQFDFLCGVICLVISIPIPSSQLGKEFLEDRGNEKNLSTFT